MNKSAKRRLVVVGGIVVIAMLVIVAIAGRWLCQLAFYRRRAGRQL